MDHLRAKRILITGATGFVGANLIRTLLHYGADVHALIRPGSQLWRLQDILPQISLHVTDLIDRQQLQDSVKQICPQIIFHLAASGVG